MANTRNQDLENHIATHIESKMDYMKEELKKDINSHLASQLASHLDSQLDSFVAKVLEKLPIPGIHSSSDQPSNLEGTTSSNSQQFQSNPFHHDLHLPRVEVNKFDGSDPTGWVTQMEHYFSLHGITDDLAKLHYGVLYLDPEHWKWWQWHRKSRQGYVAWTQFVAELYEPL
jgi:hypothetical protein